MLNIRKIAFLILVLGGIGQSISSSQKVIRDESKTDIDRVLALGFYKKDSYTYMFGGITASSENTQGGGKIIIFPDLKLCLDEGSIKELDSAACEEDLSQKVKFKTYEHYKVKDCYKSLDITIPVKIQKKAASNNRWGHDWFEIEVPTVSVEIFKGDNAIETRTVECGGEVNSMKYVYGMSSSEIALEYGYISFNSQEIFKNLPDLLEKPGSWNRGEIQITVTEHAPGYSNPNIVAKLFKTNGKLRLTIPKGRPPDPTNNPLKKSRY